MRAISTLEPTRYEITARHTDGRTFLVAYAGGSPSRPRLMAALRARAPEIVRALGVADDAVMHFGTKPRPHAAIRGSGWLISYTGRTQRDCRTGGEHPFISSNGATKGE